MKLIIPFICSLLLVGCSNETQKQSAASTENNVSVEENQTVATEANTSDAAAMPTATASSDVKPLEADAATLFAQKCASCHGAKAEKAALNKSQIIAGWDKQKIKNALNGYKNGTYGGTMKDIMKNQVANKTDAQIDILAEYISKLK